MFVAYLRTFARMGLQAIPMQADTGPIGGDLSHEFIILASTGESEVYCHRDLLERDVLADDVDYEDDLTDEVERWTSLYAATDEKHDPSVADELGDQLVQARGIEVGHIFYFGTKYSTTMGANVIGPEDDPIALEMGSYGIGVSRLVGALIEAHHDDAGIIWPDAVAPFNVGVINLKTGDEACDATCEDIYRELNAAGIYALLDDRAERAGVKFADMDLIGLPWQVIVGPRGVSAGTIELKRRATGKREEISFESALARLTS
jgi:prolyl-tRNA synthetase